MGDLAIDHHADALGHIHHHTEVLLDQQDGDFSALGKAAQGLLHLLHDHRRQAFSGLVHHQQLGLQQQRAANGQHLLLAAR